MEAVGPILVVLSIPLMLRWIPQNRLYGFRIAATLRDKSVWYDANARSGKHLFFLGLLLVALEFIVPAAIRTPALQVTAVSGLVLITVFDWKLANRWERERSRSKPS